MGGGSARMALSFGRGRESPTCSCQSEGIDTILPLKGKGFLKK
jgi:hypothetical protein